MYKYKRTNSFFFFYNKIFFSLHTDFSRRSSYEYGEGPKESEVVVFKERRLVPCEPVKEGMQRFSFLLEVCVPGSFPDPQLIAAVLDLVSKYCVVIVLKKKIKKSRCLL